MVNGIGSGGGSLAKQQIEAAFKRSQDAANRMANIANSASGGVDAKATDGSFADKIGHSLDSISRVNRDIDQLPKDLATGKISDIHEVASRLKQAELSMKFALEVRNKFIDAYTEIMRMGV